MAYKKRKLFSCLIVTITLSISGQQTTAWEKSPFFDTKFLAHYDQVEKKLIEEYGFHKVQFQAEDGLTLNGLLRNCGAQQTIIGEGGFFPGRKEGLAPLVAMLQQNCNILLFDGRGHGNSQGRFWKTLDHYGKNEYKDMLGAISFAHQQKLGHLFVHGTCASAFHAAHALIKLSEKNKLDELSVRGLIFDSGFPSFLNVLNHADQYHIKEKMLPILLSWYAQKDKIKTTLLYKICCPAVTTFEYIVKKLCLLPGLQTVEPETNLSDKMHKIACPVFFIHCENDSYVECKPVKQLADTVHTKTCWWIKNSKHALHSIIHTQEYRKKLLEFMNSIV